MPLLRKRYLAGLLAGVAALLVVLFWQSGKTIDGLSAIPEEPSNGEGFAPVLPLKAIPGLSADKVALGARLFRDTRLSRDNTVACASCHSLAKGGADGARYATGIGGAVGGINTPTVLNAAFGFVQFWDGRAATLEEQAAGPIHNPIEMDSNWAQVLPKLRADSDYVARFARLYKEGMTPATVVDAIATFERSLVTVDAPFDRYLQGDKTAIGPEAVEGYRRFRDYGCTSCHQGTLLGGNMFQKFGVLGDYFAGREPTTADQGRYNVTQREEDRHVFKVPTLRNVALTAPYFHDGAAATLEEAVALMGRYQLGRELTGHDVQVIVAFLRTLTGRLPPAPAGGPS